MTETRRPNRTKDERREAINKKIEWHKECIDSLTTQLDELNKPPKQRVQSFAEVIRTLKESGLTPEQIIAKIQQPEE